MADGRKGRRIFRATLRRPRGREAVELEIRHHLEAKVERLMERGLTREEAEREARRAFGDLEGVAGEMKGLEREREGRMKREALLSGVVQDVRYGLRGIRRNPGFAAAVIVTLGLGLGAVAAIFTVVDAVLLRPLPFQEPERLATMGLRLGETTVLPFVPLDQAREWDREGDFFHGMAYHYTVQLVRTDGPEPVQVTAEAVTHDLDEVLGIRPALGRAFLPEDTRGSGARTVVLMNAFWRELGAPRDILGSTLTFGDDAYTVVGVLPRGVKFPFPSQVDLWIPLADDGTAAGLEQSRAEVLLRLGDGVGLEGAQERADALAGGFAEQRSHPWGWSVRLASAAGHRANDDVRKALLTVLGAVGVMLLVALVNGINLLLVRSSVRARETAVRLALGASRIRLLRQLVAESLILGLMAGGVAVLLALGGVEAAADMLPRELTWASVFEFRVERRVLLLTFGLAALVGLIMGILPGLQILGGRPLGRELAGARRVAGDATSALRQGLVVVEVALSVALLAGAGLMVRSFGVLTAVDPGFRTEGLAFLTVAPSELRYPDGTDRLRFFQDLEARLEGLPGVSAVTAASSLPPDGDFAVKPTLEAEGGPPIAEEEQPFTLPYTRVNPDFLRVMELTLVAGRPLEERDGGEGRVVIDLDLARFLWGDADPVGRRFRLESEREWLQVVGVVEELKLGELDASLGDYAILYPQSRAERPAWQSFAVRTVDEPRTLLPEIRRAVYGLDAQQPVYELVTAREALSESIEKPRFLMSLMVLMAGVGASLSAVGMYGVLSYAVSRRSRELGIRVALGAEAGEIRRMVVGQGLRLGLLGVALGVGVALATGRIVRSLLYEVEPDDPGTLLAIAGLAMVMTVVASWAPARRATSVDPVRVLKEE